MHGNPDGLCRNVFNFTKIYEFRKLINISETDPFGSVSLWETDPGSKKSTKIMENFNKKS